MHYSGIVRNAHSGARQWHGQGIGCGSEAHGPSDKPVTWWHPPQMQSAPTREDGGARDRRAGKPRRSLVDRGDQWSECTGT